MTNAAIVATGIAKYYRRGGAPVVGLSPTTLSIGPGDFVAVTGPSLSGKTTLVNLLAGWETPDAGTITWNRAAGKVPLWTEVAVVPQSFALLDELTVVENVTLGLSAQDDAYLDELFADLGITQLRDRTTAEISVGERQRVMVARALAVQAPVVLADEPVAHQDQRHATAVLERLAAAAAHGTACLIATRESEIAARADRCLLLEDRD